MADQGTLDVIREALRDSAQVDPDRIELVLDDGAVVLRGAVATAQEADVAAMLAEQHAEGVRNQLRVDPGVRGDTPDGQATQQTDVAMSEMRDDLTPDITEALGENVPWDPPEQPHLAPTESEQRQVLDRSQEPEEVAEQGAPVDEEPLGGPSLPELSAAEFARDARPDRDEPSGG